jgi:hypothetical protein
MQMPEVLEYFKFYDFFQVGHALTDGGVVNQPAKAMEIFDLIGKIRGRK